MQASNGNLTLLMMAIWICILGACLSWLELDSRRQDKLLARTTANAFYQQAMFTRQWNASHAGVYVPITAQTPPNPYLPLFNRDLTAGNGIKLTKVNPSYMTRQIADLAKHHVDGIQFHVTSLKPISPENKPTEWEERWLTSFEQGAKEQGEFFEDGKITWFRYMAPLVTTADCLKCHGQQGYKAGDIRGGLSVSLPYPPHSHANLLIGFGAVAAIGLLFILIGGTIYERKQLLFDATFNNTIPTCVTAADHTILLANESYWAEFGPLPGGQKTIKCHEHRPGKTCHTENCPLTQILNGKNQYLCEPSKEKDGKPQHFIVTARPLRDFRGKVIGAVESFQEITVRKRLEDEKEHLIRELQQSLAQVKLLSGFIPICASCKKVRDDQGFWSQVESYISKHSEAKFSHGICPDCVQKLYPGIYDQVMAELSPQAPEHQTDQEDPS